MPSMNKHVFLYNSDRPKMFDSNIWFDVDIKLISAKQEQ